jgi:hypothetical protein
MLGTGHREFPKLRWPHKVHLVGNKGGAAQWLKSPVSSVMEREWCARSILSGRSPANMHVHAVLRASLVQRAVASVLLNAVLSRLRSIYPRDRETLSTSFDRRSRSPRLLCKSWTRLLPGIPWIKRKRPRWDGGNPAEVAFENICAWCLARVTMLMVCAGSLYWKIVWGRAGYSGHLRLAAKMCLKPQR